MKRNLAKLILLSSVGLLLQTAAWAGQAPGAASDPDVAISHHDRVYTAEPPAVAAAYDFSPFKTIVDVGGATGNLLATILVNHAGPRFAAGPQCLHHHQKGRPPGS